MPLVERLRDRSGRLRTPPQTVSSVYVRGKRRLRVTGARAQRTIRVKHLPASRYTIEVRVRTKDGRTVKAKRTYKRCPKAR